jgi:hypothetical protein
MVESDYNGTFKLWMPQATTHEWTERLATTHEWTERIANWWLSVHPTTNIDLAANSDLASNLNFTVPPPFFEPQYPDWYYRDH